MTFWEFGQYYLAWMVIVWGIRMALKVWLRLLVLPND